MNLDNLFCEYKSDADYDNAIKELQNLTKKTPTETKSTLDAQLIVAIHEAGVRLTSEIGLKENRWLYELGEHIISHSTSEEDTNKTRTGNEKILENIEDITYANNNTENYLEEAG